MPKKQAKRAISDDLVSQVMSQVARKRWSKVSKRQRSEIASGLAKAASDSMTPEERSERARKAGLAAGKKRRGET